MNLPTLFLRPGAIFAACALLHSVAIAEPVVIVPKSSAGEAFNLVLTKSRQRQIGTQQAQRNKVETPLEVRVLEAGPNRAVVAWTSGETRVLEPKTAPDANTKALLDLGKGVRMEIELEGPDWTPRLRNYEEVKVRFDKIVDQVLTMARDEKERAQLKQVLDRMFASREAVEASLLKDAVIYFFPLGKSVEAAKPLTYDTVISTPLGGRPIPARGVVKLVSTDPKAGKATLEWTQTLDAKAAGEALKAWMERTSKQLGKPMPPDDKLPRFEISDRGEFVIRTASGWPDSARHTRKIVAPGGAETQTVEFVRK